MERDILSLKFVGSRFDKHTIPLSMLSDLTQINKAVTDVASRIYLTKNPERQRVPKGFRDNVFLSLKGLSEGSAVISLEATHLRLDQQTTSLESTEEECLKEAFGAIIDYVSGDLSESSKYLEKIISPYFNQIGQGLRPKESLSFEYGNKKTSTLDAESRYRLIKKKSDYSAVVEVYGIVDAMDRQTETFKITDNAKGQRVEVHMEKGILPDAKKAFEGYDAGQKAYVRGSGLYRDQKLQKIESVVEFQLLDPLDVPYRLNELLNMKDGWMEDGGGTAPNKDALLKLSALFDEYYWSDKILPHAYPTPSGNIEMEWTIGRRGLILEVNLSTFSAEMTDTDSDDVTRFDLDTIDGWSALNTLLREANTK